MRPAPWFSLLGEVANLPEISQSGVTSVNVRAGLGSAGGSRWRASRKLMGKDHPLDAGKTGGAFGDPTFIPAEPRFYGVQPTERQQAQDGLRSHFGQ